MSDLEAAAEVLNETAENVTAKVPSTPEGMAVAYGSLVVMALLPIFFGSFRSVRYQKEQKVGAKEHERGLKGSLGVGGSRIM